MRLEGQLYEYLLDLKEELAMEQHHAKSPYDSAEAAVMQTRISMLEDVIKRLDGMLE